MAQVSAPKMILIILCSNDKEIENKKQVSLLFLLNGIRKMSFSVAGQLALFAQVGSLLIFLSKESAFLALPAELIHNLVCFIGALDLLTVTVGLGRLLGLELRAVAEGVTVHELAVLDPLHQVDVVSLHLVENLGAVECFLAKLPVVPAELRLLLDKCLCFQSLLGLGLLDLGFVLLAERDQLLGVVRQLPVQVSEHLTHDLSEVDLDLLEQPGHRFGLRRLLQNLHTGLTSTHHVRVKLLVGAGVQVIGEAVDHLLNADGGVIAFRQGGPRPDSGVLLLRALPDGLANCISLLLHEEMDRAFLIQLCSLCAPGAPTLPVESSSFVSLSRVNICTVGAMLRMFLVWDFLMSIYQIYYAHLCLLLAVASKRAHQTARHYYDSYSLLTCWQMQKLEQGNIFQQNQPRALGLRLMTDYRKRYTSMKYLSVQLGKPSQSSLGSYTRDSTIKLEPHQAVSQQAGLNDASIEHHRTATSLSAHKKMQILREPAFAPGARFQLVKNKLWEKLTKNNQQIMFCKKRKNAVSQTTLNAPRNNDCTQEQNQQCYNDKKISRAKKDPSAPQDARRGTARANHRAISMNETKQDNSYMSVEDLKRHYRLTKAGGKNSEKKNGQYRVDRGKTALDETVSLEKSSQNQNFCPIFIKDQPIEIQAFAQEAIKSFDAECLKERNKDNQQQKFLSCCAQGTEEQKIKTENKSASKINPKSCLPRNCLFLNSYMQMKNKVSGSTNEDQQGAAKSLLEVTNTEPHIGGIKDVQKLNYNKSYYYQVRQDRVSKKKLQAQYSQQRTCRLILNQNDQSNLNLFVKAGASIKIQPW